MIEIRPSRNEDIYKLHLQTGQTSSIDLVNDDFDLATYADAGMAETLIHDDEVLAMWGAEEAWQGRVIVWALLSESAGQAMTVIHRHLVKFLKRLDARRLETYVDVGFAPGHRWVKMLGFEVEGYMKSFRPNGDDMVLYARVT